MSRASNRQFVKDNREIIMELARRGLTPEEAILCADTAEAYEAEIMQGAKKNDAYRYLRDQFKCSSVTIWRRLKRAMERP